LCSTLWAFSFCFSGTHSKEKRETSSKEGTLLNRLLIILPFLLPREVSPNFSPRGRGAEWVKRGARTELQEKASAYIKSARNLWEQEKKERWPKLDKAAIEIRISVADKRHIMDTDNFLASMKSVWDALVRADIIQDDSPDHLSFAVPVWNPVASVADEGIYLIVEGK